jgi:hypothetical protein
VDAPVVSLQVKDFTPQREQVRRTHWQFLLTQTSLVGGLHRTMKAAAGFGTRATLQQRVKASRRRAFRMMRVLRGWGGPEEAASI